MPDTANDTTELPPVLAYARATRRMHDLIAAGQGDSEEALALADEMDAPWYAMTEQEQTRMRGLSVDLYALREGGPKRVMMSKEELLSWQEAAQNANARLEAGDVDAALGFLRQPTPDNLPAYVIPFVQARCWEKLGDLETASVFMKEAERLDSGHALDVLPLSLRLERIDGLPMKMGA